MKFVSAAATGIFLLAPGAYAADIYVPSTAPAYASVGYEWGGFYAGVYGGGVWGDVSVRNDSPGVPTGPFPYTVRGPLAGASVGYNLLSGNILYGVEASAAYLASEGAGIIGSANAASHQDLTLSSGVLGDLTARFGVTVGDTLVYAKGGLGFYSGSAKQATTKAGYAPTGTSTFVGTAIGVGVEQAISSNATLNFEFEHFNFGEQLGYQTALLADPPTPAGYKFNNYTTLGFNTLKAGVKFKF